MRNVEKIIVVKNTVGLSTAVPLFKNKVHAIRLKNYICEVHAETGALPGRPISSVVELTNAILAPRFNSSGAYITRHIRIVPVSTVVATFISVVGNMDILVFDMDGDHTVVSRPIDIAMDRMILENVLARGRP